MSAPTWPTPPATVADVLSRVAEVLSVEERWTQGALARSKSGRDVLAFSPAACRWCLLGALTLAVDGVGYELFTAAEDWLAKLADSEDLADFNDTATHAELLTVLDRALTGARRAGI